MATFRDEGIVLRTMRLGEADRIITIITPEHGKVRAVAKGVRKTKSKLGGRLDLLTHVSLMCWKGRELDVITQAEVIEMFRPIREDLDKMPVAFTMLEAVDQVAVERHPMPDLLQMLVGALTTLAGDGGAVLLGAFLWKLLALEGVSPVVDQCTACGEPAELVAFDQALGGFLCRSCRSGQGVSPERCHSSAKSSGAASGRHWRRRRAGGQPRSSDSPPSPSNTTSTAGSVPPIPPRPR